MEELLAYTLLLEQELITEAEYASRLDELFLRHPEEEDLLCLEWETDSRKAIGYVRAHIDWRNLDAERFGRVLMGRLETIYAGCSDIQWFADRMYRLWDNLPWKMQETEPFRALCCADDPLSWEDEKYTRSVYERMLRYYTR